jgi:hypothetical protein
MKSLLTTTALVALLGAVPAFAEDATAPMKDQPTANDVIPDASTQAPAAQPEATTPDATKPDAAAAPDAMQKEDNAAAPADTTKDQATAPAAGDKFLTDQAENEWLASSLIGASVYNSADENLGDINDVVFNEDGSIKAVVIGVGGFLGIGEKSVAVAFSQLNKSKDANGNDKFVLGITREELDAAPAFVTLAEKQRLEAAPLPATDQMAPAPAQPAPAQ